MKKPHLIPRKDYEIDLQRLSEQCDWQDQSEMEKVLFGMEAVNYKQLIEEVKLDPSLAKLHWGDNNRTLIQVAANDGQPELFRLLLDCGADFNVCDSTEGNLLHFAANSGNTEIIQHLLEKGVSSNVKDARGITPLYWTAINHHDDALKLLLIHGAVPEDAYTKEYVRRLHEHGML